MIIGPLLGRQDNCIKTCPPVPECNCNTLTEDCVLINRDCFNCAEMKCVAKKGVKPPSSSVSKGALAGAVIGAILFLALAVALYLWFRRNTRRRKANAVTDVKDVPAPAEMVLNRPDPIEKPTPTPSVIDDTSSLQPPYVFSRDGNPFDDNHSIQTAGTGGTNVIPIALITPEQEQSVRSGAESAQSGHSGPIRPSRSPEMDLNLDHVNVSRDNLRPGGYEPSTISGISGISAGSRQSYMSGMTFASDFAEAPMIMTPTKAPIRQLLGVAKPEVISANSLQSSSNNSLRPPPSYIRGNSNKSPLAATSFGPDDVLRESDENAGNPFDDKHSSTHAEYSLSPPHTATTIHTTRQDRESGSSNWVPEGPVLPWAKSEDKSRPDSMSTQAGSVIDISSATIVNVGLRTPATASSGIRTPYRTTMGRLITPGTAATAGSLQEQQARALAHAQAQAQAQGLDKPRPISGSSAMSGFSTRADSILESFPFVPPSPISNRPLRSPPVSPLGQSTFGVSGSTSPMGQHTFVVAPPTPSGSTFEEQPEESNGALPAPPNRKLLGMSTASNLSTASTGLGSFPFQIDSGVDRPESGVQPPLPFNRQRASLDTLALTADLSSYPLGFDRPPVPGQRGDDGKI